MGKTNVDNPESIQPKAGSRLTRGLGKTLRIMGLLFLLYFMVDNLNQLSLMKQMDSKLATNEALMVKALDYQVAMQESEKLTDVMADKLIEVNSALREANLLAAETNDIAGRIRDINSSLLAVNSKLNQVVLDNIALTEIMLLQSGDMGAFLQKMNESMRVMNASAERQVALTQQLYELTVESNAGTPALP